MPLLLAFMLTSSLFHGGAYLPRAMAARDCGGSNLVPALHWSGAPPRARSFALIVHDPDAPAPGGFYHWVAYDGHQGPPTGWTQGRNDTGSLGYFGPCPPPGKAHHYHFTLYALDLPAIAAPHRLNARELLAAMRGHIVGEASLVGLWRATEGAMPSPKPSRRHG